MATLGNSISLFQRLNIRWFAIEFWVLSTTLGLFFVNVPSFPPQKIYPNGQGAGSSQLFVRTANLKDLSNLAEILADSFHPQIGIARWFYPLLRMGIYEDLRNRLRSHSPHSLCLVAVVRSATLVGFSEYPVGTVEMALRSSWHSTTQYPYISNLAVRRSHRRQGVARQLLLSCERTAREWRFQNLYLHVLEDNHSARGLYTQAGYQLQQVEGHCEAWLLGRPKRLFLRRGLGTGER